MLTADREKLFLRLEQRKRQNEREGHIPNPPAPSLYFNHVANQLTSNDPLLDYLPTKYYPDDLLSNWRCGDLNIPRKVSMRLIRMPEKHQYALLRSIGGDGTACGKIWAPALIFPLILADETTIIYRNLYQWIHLNNILEVGAGWAGTPSLTAYRLGASKVMITDGEDVMIQCAHVNIAAELSTYSVRPKGTLYARTFRWGNSSDASAILNEMDINSIDCILGCDCIYDTATVINLFNSIVNDFHCNRVIFCWETRDHRYDAEETFFQQLLFQYSFRIKYFTSTLLSDLSYQTASTDIKLCCDEIRSYLDSYQSSSAGSDHHPHHPHHHQSQGQSQSQGQGHQHRVPGDKERYNERNDINFLLAERLIPLPTSPADKSSPVRVRERGDGRIRGGGERTDSQAEEKKNQTTTTTTTTTTATTAGNKEALLRKESKRQVEESDEPHFPHNRHEDDEEDDEEEEELEEEEEEDKSAEKSHHSRSKK